MADYEQVTGGGWCAEVHALPDMLARLKLVGLRDRFDGLLDETHLAIALWVRRSGTATRCCSPRQRRL